MQRAQRPLTLGLRNNPALIKFGVLRVNEKPNQTITSLTNFLKTLSRPV